MSHHHTACGLTTPCYNFRYSYRFEEQGADGYSEIWCTAPADGFLADVSYVDDGEIVAFVTADGVMPGPVREQPPQGWNCPTS